MKIFALSIAMAASVIQAASDRPPTRNVGSMSDLMVKIIYPASDALFYIEKEVKDWKLGWPSSKGRR